MSVQDAIGPGIVALLAVLSLWAGIDLVRDLFRAVASRHWPVVRGTVVTSGWQDKGGGNFEPRVVYRYEVGGRQRDGNRIAFWGSLGVRGFSEGSAEEWSQRWVEGWDVDVRHHPTRPEIAVLLPGLNARLIFSVLGALFLDGILLAAVFLYLTL